jgi:hypothetical protein
MSYGRSNSDASGSLVRCKTGVSSPSQIYPNLKMTGDCEKILIEASIARSNSFLTKSGNQLTDKQSLGFHFINPRCGDWGDRMYFRTVVIFTPKPGLFTETAPS